MRREAILHRFVDLVPDKLEEGILYISLEHGTVLHKCCCGCGGEVVTPLSPTDWRFTYDGSTISLYPSVGNWSFRCRSHYIIERGKVWWVRTWNSKEVETKRQWDAKTKKSYYLAQQEDDDRLPPNDPDDSGK